MDDLHITYQVEEKCFETLETTGSMILQIIYMLEFRV